MNSVVYILRKTLKNRILDLIHHPGKLVAYLAVAALLGFSFFTMTLNPPESEDFQVMDIRILQGVYFALLTFIVMTNLIKGVESGSTFFTMSDVNMLFISPVSPKKILVYGLVKQMGMTILIAFCMIAYGGMAIRFFGISWGQALLLFAGFILILLIAQIFTILIYSYCNGNANRIRTVKSILYGVVILILAYVGLTVYQNGFSMENLMAAITAPLLQWVPLIGWMTGGIFSIINGFDLVGILCFALLAAATGAALLAFLRSDADFYEDVLQNTESAYEIKQAAKEGNIQLNMPGQKIRKVKDTGINRGWGASAFFFKHIREMGRRSPFVFWGGSTLMQLACGVFMAFMMMRVSNDDGEAMSANFVMMVATIMCIYILFFLNAAGQWSKEMMKPHLYLVPASPFKKLVFASLTSLLTPLADGLVIFTALAVITKANPLTAVICLLMYVSFGFIYTAFNILSERLFGQMANKGLILMLYAFVLIFAVTPGVVGGILLGVIGSMPPVVMGLPVVLWNTGVSAFVYFLCKETINNIELKG